MQLIGMSYRLIVLACLLPVASLAASLVVKDQNGAVLATTMVTRSVAGQDVVATSDNGYPPPGVINSVVPQHTRFTNADGVVEFADLSATGERRYRVRKQGYADAVVTAANDAEAIEVTLALLTDAKEIAESKPANLWLSELQFDWADDPAQAREHFLLHCGFCHQQGSVFMRLSRTEEQWAAILERMDAYGAMAAEDFLDEAPAGLVAAHADLNRRHAELPAHEEWDATLSAATITEWPIGDGFSQMHDFVLHPNGKVYVGDNLMDRIYALDPKSGEYEVFKVPHDEDAEHGGVLGSRMDTYPKTDNYMGVHSFAISPADGHIFVTPSMQQELIEFDPDSGEFTRHKFDEGFYPHTIRIDDKDRVWFTLALSSQVGMFNRVSGEFTIYDLPSRGVKEWAALKIIDFRLSFGFVGSPPDFDWETSGFPMPYGIDVSPVDGSVWVARLYADDIARIDPETEEITGKSLDRGVLGRQAGAVRPACRRIHCVRFACRQRDAVCAECRSRAWCRLGQRQSVRHDHVVSHRERNLALIHIDPGMPADPVVVQGSALYGQHCDTCHSLPDMKAPDISTLKQMPFTRIARSIEFGMMMQQAAHLKSEERYAIAKYLSSDSSEARDEWIAEHSCRTRKLYAVSPGGEDNWGFGTGNRRALEKGVQISSANVDSLSLKWSLAFPGVTEMRSQPVAADDALFVGTSNGNVFGIDQDSGCIRWRFAADSSVRSSLNLAVTSDGKATLFFADDLGTVYAVSANEGRLRWKQSLRWFPVSVISGSLTFFEDRLYVPISSFETALAGLDTYPCCRSHGGVAALDATDGTIVWQYHTTPQAMKVDTTSAGTDVWGPSGAAVWTTPAVDPNRRLLYIGTAQNMSPPATHNSDSVVALNIETGAEEWVFQALKGDVWNVACHLGGANCPDDAGPDFDFGGGITLTRNSAGDDIIIAGQKSGHVYTLDPDRKGAVIWQQRLSMGTSNGGIHWGVATSGDTIWATVADPPRQRAGYVPKPGIHSLNLANGAINWSVVVERDCEFDLTKAPRVGLAAMLDAEPANPWPACSFYYGHSAAPVYANGLVYAGALDGKLRILDSESGEVLRSIETNRSFAADNGIDGHGGAIDLSGVVVDGQRLFLYSGYGMFGQMPGNILLGYEVTP